MSPGTYYIDQVDLELGDPPASVFLTLGLKRDVPPHTGDIQHFPPATILLKAATLKIRNI